jgi:hypothetical protein
VIVMQLCYPSWSNYVGVKTTRGMGLNMTIPVEAPRAVIGTNVRSPPPGSPADGWSALGKQ